MPTPISPAYTRGDLIAMIHQRDALVSDLKAVISSLRYQIEAELRIPQLPQLSQETEHDRRDQ